MKTEKTTTTAETAQYIGGMARELRTMASNSNLGFIVYLLSMVEQEATTLAADGSSEAGAYKRSGGGR